MLCEEPRAAYDRVHLSEFFAGKSADDLSLVAPGFFENDNMLLKLNARAVGVDRAAKTVTVSSPGLGGADGERQLPGRGADEFA